MKKDVLVGTAGHIDHGKTTLLKALTGIDTDRLKEEKQRGISIDLGFAHMELGPYRIGFIDVPGHERFVKNMLAGVGGIHLVLLVVAADESIMPQTVEHFQICKLLEIPSGVVVITKKNLVETELLPLVEEEIRELVRGSHLAEAPVVAIDSISGEGLDALREALLQELARSDRLIASRRSSPYMFRFPIDRVFTIRGFGTVITGTPYAGSLAKGDSVTVHPIGKSVKVRGIEIFNQPADRAVAGQRTALNLSGLDKKELERGMVITAINAFRPSSLLDAVVHLLPNAPQPLKRRSRVRFHHGSAELIGRLHLLEGEHLAPGQSGLVQVRLEKPTVCCPKDHFILRRYSPVITIGGGIVLDSGPEKHRQKDLNKILPDLRKLWSLSQNGDFRVDRALVEYLVKCHSFSGWSLTELAARTGFLESYLLELLKELESVVVVPQEPPLVLYRSSLEELKTRIAEFLNEFHSSHPLVPGVPQEELKKRFLPGAESPYLQYVLDLLQAAKKIRVSEGLVSAYGQRVELNPEQQKIRERLLELISSSSLQTPGLNEITARLPYDPKQVQNVFYFLLKSAELVRVNDDMVLTTQQMEWLKGELKKAFPSGKRFSVPQFKDLFKVTRKYAIPLLEFLDRQRITRRIGDERLVL